MKILVMGSSGSTGKRYCAILRSLGVEVAEYDLFEYVTGDIPKGDAAIIATPTKKHYTHCVNLIEAGYKKILVEKPMSKEPEEIGHFAYAAWGVDIRVVCNWAFTLNSTIEPGKQKVCYDYYNHGRDVPEWDLCQLIYLGNDESEFKHDSPTFKATIAGKKVCLGSIERSYVRMLAAWLENPKALWGLNDAMAMTKKVIKKIKAGK